MKTAGTFPGRLRESGVWAAEKDKIREDVMKKNMGPVQRIIWVVLGIALLAWALFGSGDYKWIGWIGVVPLVTGIIGWCGINAVLGINTCKNC